MILNLAATNEYEIFLDAVIDDDKDELRVESWSPMTVSNINQIPDDAYTRLSITPQVRF